MSVSLIPIRCPKCGANLNIEEGRSTAFCTYCGTKILIHNENEHIYRHIDEAGIKKAETDQMMMLKKMELAEKNRVDREKTKKLKVIISLSMAVLGMLLMVLGFILGHNSGDPDSGLYALAMVGMFSLLGGAYIWLFSKKKDEDDDDLGDKTKVPDLTDYQKDNYIVMKTKFEDAGFTNIKCIPLNDLTVGLMKKPGMVASISVNGIIQDSERRKYSKDAPVIISYHSLNR